MSAARLAQKRSFLQNVRKRAAQMPQGMGLLGSILNACGPDGDQASGLAGMKSSLSESHFSGSITSPSNNHKFHFSKADIIAVSVAGAVILALLGLGLFCCFRRRSMRRAAASSKAPLVYPEVSYLYDPPPGAPSPNMPGAPMMAAQRGMPDTSYMGAAGVAASHGEPHSEKEGLLPSARSVLAPLSGYKRAEQDESHDLGDREHLNPFTDQPGGEYRDSIDAQHH